MDHTWHLPTSRSRWRRPSGRIPSLTGEDTAQRAPQGAWILLHCGPPRCLRDIRQVLCCSVVPVHCAEPQQQQGGAGVHNDSAEETGKTSSPMVIPRGGQEEKTSHGAKPGVGAHLFRCACKAGDTYLLGCACRERTGICWLPALITLRHSPDRKLKMRILPSPQPVITRRKRNARLSTSLWNSRRGQSP